jgi:hypothetical protein
MATVGGRLRHVGEALAAEPSTAPLRLDVQVFEKGPVCPEAVENGPAAPDAPLDAVFPPHGCPRGRLSG